MQVTPWRRSVSVVVKVGVSLLLAVTGLQLTSFVRASSAPAAVRINAGGPVQNVNGTQWTGCTSMSACNGYVKGGFAWAQQPPPKVTGFPANTNVAMHQNEWTGGQTNGVASGGTAFSFNVPTDRNTAYDVTLQFTELNKFRVGDRVFDVNIENQRMLTGFDIYREAGAYKTVSKTFRVLSDGTVNIDFIRRTENAKVDAIEIVPVASASTSTTTSAPTTTAPPQSGGTVQWTSIAKPLNRTIESTGGVIGRKLYQFGGYQLDPGFYKPITAASVYDMDTNTWAPVAPVPRGITHASKAIDGNRFIILGAVATQGTGEVPASTEVFTYDTVTNSWGTLAPLPSPRGSGGVALVGRTLHFFGGVDMDKVERSDHWTLNLDDPTAGWQSAAAYPTTRSHFAAVVVDGGFVYALGGQTGWERSSSAKQEMFRYDSSSDTWAPMASMPVVRSHIGETTTVVGGRIWIFGGEEKYNQWRSDIYSYDIATNAWTRSASNLPVARFSGIGGSTGNTVFYVNGSVYNDGAWKGTIS